MTNVRKKLVRLHLLLSGRIDAQGCYERCVLCGRETDVPLDLPIARRDCCIKGGGQLCRDCWQKLYGR